MLLPFTEPFFAFIDSVDLVLVWSVPRRAASQPRRCSSGDFPHSYPRRQMTLFSKQVVLALALLAGPFSAASLFRGTNSTAPGACIELYGECLGPNDDNTKNCCPGNYCDGKAMTLFTA